MGVLILTVESNKEKKSVNLWKVKDEKDSERIFKSRLPPLQELFSSEVWHRSSCMMFHGGLMSSGAPCRASSHRRYHWLPFLCSWGQGSEIQQESHGDGAHGY